ncbi:hypothetical protein TURU_082412 [Turdus rufiventris]|nr:hypothetical protein TURU_082412 [Turdus rufiventris]
MVSRNGQLEWSAGMVSRNGQLEWSAGVVNWNGQPHWSGGVVRWNGQLEWSARLVSCAGQPDWSAGVVSQTGQLCWLSRTPRWTQVSSLPYVTFQLPLCGSCVHSTSSEMLRAPAISLAGSEHKGLFLVSAGDCKTGNVLSSALLSSRAGLCLFSCSPAGFWSQLCLIGMGETGSTSPGDSWKQENSVEMAGMGLSQLLPTSKIKTK